MLNLEFRLKKKDETRNYLLEEIKQNDLMSKKHKKTCKYLNHVEHWPFLASPVTTCVLISAFASLVCAPIGMTCSAVGKKNCAIPAGIKKYKLIIKKNKKKHNKIALLGKTKLDTVEVLISRVLIDSFISHNEFF